jgi:hypothetical protein
MKRSQLTGVLNVSLPSGTRRLIWGVVLTPVAGFIGTLVPLTINLSATLQTEVGSLMLIVVAGVIYGSFFAWPVTIVIFPISRNIVSDRGLKSFLVFLSSGLASGFLVCIIVYVIMAGFWSTPKALEFATIGAISGFLTAIPYFFLTNPGRSADGSG